MKRKINKFKIELFLKIVLMVIVLSFTYSLSYPVTDTLQAIKDNTLYEDESGSLSNGAGQYIFAGKTSAELLRRALIAFDVSSIPPCATISSVKLQLHMSMAPIGASPNQFELRKTLTNWGEGLSDAGKPGGGGALAESGDATWIHTYYDTAFWDRSGGDFSPVTSSSTTVGTSQGFYTFNSTAEMIADVQDWLNNSQNNFGWGLLGDDSDLRTARRFDSRNNSTIEYRPKLIVEYTLNKLSLNLTSIIEGFWNGQTMVSDTVKVFLRSSVSPYPKVDSVKIKLNSAGNGVFCFNNAGSGSYYISITHRNSIETWSKLPQTFTIGTNKVYDFTTAAAKAYGNNLVLKLGKYCIYSADVNQNGVVDIIDISLVENDAFNFVSGYVRTDVNGNNVTDVIDLSITDNNTYNFVSKMTPP